MLIKSTIEEFNSILGSKSPTPGGGSVAALSGALGAELLSMVCNLSLGKAGLEAHQKLLENTRIRAGALAAILLKRVDLDTQAFNEVMEAFKMPQRSAEEKKARSEAIQAGYMEAAQSPLGVASKCLELLRLIADLLDKFNPTAISDLGVAALEAKAGLEGAVMNVQINLPFIKNERFVSDSRLRARTYLAEGDAHITEIYDYIQNKMR